MKLFNGLLRWIQSFVNVSAAQHLPFRGYIPALSQLRNIIGRPGQFELIHSNRPLRRYLNTEKRNAVVMLCSNGDQHGFHIHSESSHSKPVYISDDWWQATSHNVYLYAYACHSATFLQSSDITRFLVNCIGYRGDLWFWFGSEFANAFWSDFFVRLYRLLKKQERIDLEVSIKVRELYNSFLIEKLRKKTTDITAQEMRLNLACLNYHLEDLQFIRGARLWTDT